MNRSWRFRVFLLFVALSIGSDLVSFSREMMAAQVGVTVPAGFSIKSVADNSLATNIYCLSTDSRGGVYVSGPGYIRRLIDGDEDGVFDSAKQYASLPKSGAQGLLCEGDSILAVGDGGIWRFDDTDRDGLADGPPQRLIAVETRGEHYAHAIRRGADGWLYCVCGNETPVPDEFQANQFSPVKEPRAGFLMRISPDYKIVEVVAHGFRNAYDFDFNSLGETFVYDSDGERDISLPWYRPTRVFRIQPGDDAGWVSVGWKRPSYFFDMPEEIGEFGRGSPTGVVCYGGVQFPGEYQDAIFAADWTFGKIYVLKRDSKTGRYDRGSAFAFSNDQFGFAVTDLAVASDGGLLASVGGRGTTGSVYRIAYEPNDSGEKVTVKEALAENDASAEVEVPLPLRTTFSKRTAWSQVETEQVLRTLASDNIALRNVALESLIGRVGSFPFGDEKMAKLLCEGLIANLVPFDRQRAKLVHRIHSQLKPPLLKQFVSAEPIDPNDSSLELALFAALGYETKFLSNNEFFDILKRCLQAEQDDGDLARLGHLVLGDCGAKNCPEFFMGYTAKKRWNESKIWKGLCARNLANAIQFNADRDDRVGAMELGRLAAMMGLGVEAPVQSQDRQADDRGLPRARRCGVAILQAAMLEQIEKNSPVADDIHWLACLAQTGVLSDKEMSVRVAEALVSIDQKLKALGLPTDRNWIPRMRELVQRLFENSTDVAEETARLISGRDGQTFLIEEMPKEFREAAIAKFAESIENDFGTATVGQLQVVAKSKKLLEEYAELLRRAARFEHLKDAATLALAPVAQAQDRTLYVDGLKSWDPKLVKTSAVLLRRKAVFLENLQPDELMVTFKATDHLGWDRQGVAVRDSLIQLLQEQTGKSFAYQYKQVDQDQSHELQQWRAYLKERFPDEFATMFERPGQANFEERLAGVEWSVGDAERGQAVYRQLKCAQCHDGTNALGPRLEGIGKRFNRHDLFRAIGMPSEQIPDRYRATIVSTKDGQLYKGTVVYESVDGVTLQDTNGKTIRINQSEIEEKVLSDKSLMPDGLLNGLEPFQWADLGSYLETL